MNMIIILQPSNSNVYLHSYFLQCSYSSHANSLINNRKLTLLPDLGKISKFSIVYSMYCIISVLDYNLKLYLFILFSAIVMFSITILPAVSKHSNSHKIPTVSILLIIFLICFFFCL